MAEPKFRSKDLHYENAEPAFLQRLRAEHGGHRQNVQFARAKKERLGAGDGEDDGPTIVDEGGERVSKEDFEALTRGDEKNDDAAQSKADPAGNTLGDLQVPTEVKELQKVADIGGAKKRKQIKVIGDDEGAAKEDKVPDLKAKVEVKSMSKNAAAKKKKKKKKKKVKLSFDDEPQV